MDVKYRKIKIYVECSTHASKIMIGRPKWKRHL